MRYTFRLLGLWTEGLRRWLLSLRKQRCHICSTRATDMREHLHKCHAEVEIRQFAERDKT